MSGYVFGLFSALGSANQTIASATSLVFGGIDNNNKIGSEVSVQVTYDATATQEAVVQIERDIDGTNYEGEASAPWAVSIPFEAGTTKERTITIPGDMVSRCQIRVVNDSGADLTNVNVRYKQATFV
jgi:hypothetical protein